MTPTLPIETLAEIMLRTEDRCAKHGPTELMAGLGMGEHSFRILKNSISSLCSTDREFQVAVAALATGAALGYEIGQHAAYGVAAADDAA